MHLGMELRIRKLTTVRRFTQYYSTAVRIKWIEEAEYIGPSGLLTAGAVIGEMRMGTLPQRAVRLHWTRRTWGWSFGFGI